MLLQTLKINNFCAIDNLEINFGGKDVNIYGDNATGKTTIANAVMWLFSGKSSVGTAEFDPQPLDENNGKVHNLETSVEAVMLENGVQTAYKRTLSEVWTKKRGCKAEELTGCKTAYYVDGVPLKENEFQSVIDNIADSELFKILSIVSYFSNMNWQNRRARLIDVCGDVTDSDVINSDDELLPLLEFLKNGDKSYTVEEFQRIAKSKKSDIKKEIDGIPARVSENKNAMPIVIKEKAEIQDELTALEKAKQTLQEQLADDDRTQAVRKAVAEAENAFQIAKTSFLSKQNVKNTTINKDVSDLRKTLEKATNNLFSATDEGKRLNLDIIGKNGLREQLLSDYEKIRAEQYAGNGICPCCGQALPPDKIEQAVSEFNKTKSDKLAKISARANAEEYHSHE